MYGFIVTFAIFFVLTSVENKCANQQKEFFWKTSFFVILAGLAGARFYHVLHYYQVYFNQPLLIFNLLNGGLSIIGAFLFGFPTLVLICKFNKQLPYYWLDLICINLPLAQAFGRLANVINNELLPIAYYEMFMNLLLFASLKYLMKKRLNLISGSIFYYYTIGYCIIRIILEPLRADSWFIANIPVTYTLLFTTLLITITKLYQQTKETK